MGTYKVMTASTTPSSNCWGTYRRVGIVELEPGYNGVPKMISERAKGVVRVVETWENLNVGITDRCAYRRALATAQEIVDELNGVSSASTT